MSRFCDLPRALLLALFFLSLARVGQAQVVPVLSPGGVHMVSTAINAFSNSGPPVYRPGSYLAAGSSWQTGEVCLRGGDLLLVAATPEHPKGQRFAADQLQRVVVKRDTFQVLREFDYQIKQKPYHCAAGFVQQVVRQDGYAVYSRWHFDRPNQAEPTIVYLLRRTADGPLETVPQQPRAFQEFMLPILADNAELRERMRSGQLVYSQTPFVIWQYLQVRR
ncbi:hypothetical protein GCM10027048_24910 [Hymenobacter coalescens]